MVLGWTLFSIESEVDPVIRQNRGLTLFVELMYEILNFTIEISLEGSFHICFMISEKLSQYAINKLNILKLIVILTTKKLES